MFRWLEVLLNLLLPQWRHRQKPDENHSYGRTLSRRYRARKGVVKNFWIVAGAAMLLNPILPVIIVLALFTTFLSFMYLDEAA